MWDFSDTFVTFDNPLYFFDGSGPGAGGPTQVYPGGGPTLYGGRVILAGKKLSETVIVPFDFISKLAFGETITSGTVSCSVYTGVDTNPSAMIIGTATVSGTILNQLVGFPGGVLGVIYELLARVSTTLGQNIELSGYLAVIPDLP